MKKNSVMKQCLIVAALAIALLVIPGGAVLAEPPPYGMVIDDMWAYEWADEYLQVAYSMTPVPSYREIEGDNAGNANLMLAPGTVFEFFYAGEVRIYAVLERSGGDTTVDLPALYVATENGSYVFNNPGSYHIAFGNAAALEVDVMGNTVSTPPAPTGDIKVYVNGYQLFFDVPPQIVDGRTLVPLRAIFEALGATVEWEAETQTITAVRGDITIFMQIGSNMLTRNNTDITLDVPAQLVEGRTLVPVRAVAESFDAIVDWDHDNRAVIITD